jgi:myo-inositol-1(or 4)-monophosphatase
LTDPLQAAVAAAREAGEIAMRSWGRPLEIAEKSARADIVTDVDRACEDAIVAGLRRDFPDAGFVTEESGRHPGSADESWIVDPIDGTTNFAHGYPLFCISIAYQRSNRVDAGVIYAPALDETFTARRGAGALRNGKPIAVSKITSLGRALTCTGFRPWDFERNAAYFRAVSARAQGVRRDGSAALDLAYVACGRFDGFWEWDLNAWDVAAGTLLIEESGGEVTQIDGSPATLDARSILASNGRIHRELAATLASAFH